MGQNINIKTKKKILLIVKRENPEPHYELHFDESVEFWTIDGRHLKTSKVEPYP